MKGVVSMSIPSASSGQAMKPVSQQGMLKELKRLHPI